MVEAIVMIDIDNLGVDSNNIRGGEWDGNQELVEDIRQHGIMNPLLVRPAGKGRYAIVAGSRRYHAAIEAGLKEIPAVVEEMDDITAMGRSIAENAHRKDTPGWMYVVKIGEMYERLNHNGKKMEVVEIIMEKTGFSQTQVLTYIDISTLPSDIIELMKEPNERSESVKELLKKTSPGEVNKVLDTHKALKIVQELQGLSKEKMFEVAAFVLDLPRDTAFAIIERVKTYPKNPLIELQEMVTAIPKGGRFIFEFGSNIIRGLDTACIKRQMDRKSLVVYYVESGLKKDGYL